MCGDKCSDQEEFIFDKAKYVLVSLISNYFLNLLKICPFDFFGPSDILMPLL